jgi:acyl-CoA synthetase (AMP-forming)/AMP-acid ligase II
VQIGTFEKPYRDSIIKDVRNQTDYTENVLGLLPMSHIYGLVVICHASVFRGDGVIVLPKFEFATTLRAIQDHKINTLFLVSPPLGLAPNQPNRTEVPPIIILMTKNQNMLAKYDLSSVGALFSGAAPLGQETADDLQKIFPSWKIRQGYGMRLCRKLFVGVTLTQHRPYRNMYCRVLEFAHRYLVRLLWIDSPRN